MRSVTASLLLSLFSAINFSPRTQTPGTTSSSEIRLQQARQALTGERKSTEKARQILLDMINGGESSLRPDSLCYAYVYLGYIADRTGDREGAVTWYRRAVAITDGDAGILAVARKGIETPITWIRHLDQPEPSRQQTQPVRADRPASAANGSVAVRGYVTESPPPPGLIPAQTLSAEQWQENFEFLWDAIDRNYACFTLKSIDWSAIHARYRERLKSVTTTDAFYFLLFQLVNELKDTHSWLDPYRPFTPGYGPGLSTDLFEGKPYIVAVKPDSSAHIAGVKVGAEILAIDGLTVEDKMEQMRPYLRACSSERAYKREACRRLLGGPADATVIVKLLSPDGNVQTLSLKRDSILPGRRPVFRTLGFQLTRQRFVHFGRHPSGLGYICIESFNGHEEVADEFDTALEALRNTPGLIIDIRDNPGGYGQPRIVGRFIRSRTRVAVAFKKKGPRHNDLAKSDTFLTPRGNWQYAGPVVLLVNDVTGSASDLFACYMRGTHRVTIIGSTTHGNLSGVAAYAVLPCGLVARISNGYVCDAKGRPIEGHGNEPDIAVTASIGDFLAGKDPALEKGVAFLHATTQETEHQERKASKMRSSRSRVHDPRPAKISLLIHEASRVDRWSVGRRRDPSTTRWSPEDPVNVRN